MKELPNIFKPKIDKNLNNNSRVYYSSLNNNDTRSSNNLNKRDIKAFVLRNNYASKVIINTHNKSYESKIIDRMGNNIILEDNTVLSINEIESIYDI